MSPILLWIAIAIFFLIIEMVTSTFYGLSLALSAAIVAMVTYILQEPTITILQGGVFAIASLIFALVIPKLLISHEPITPQGADKYIGQVRSARKVGGEYKISLDGVDYLIESETDITVGDKVEIIGHKGASMKVRRANSDNR